MVVAGDKQTGRSSPGALSHWKFLVVERVLRIKEPGRIGK